MSRFSFRAWHKTLKTMARVDLVDFINKEILVDDSSVPKGLKTGGKKFYDTWTLDECILLQSTYKVDKDGAEIYEGDVVDFNGLKMLVEWIQEEARFGMYHMFDGKIIPNENTITLKDIGRFKIIGTKFTEKEGMRG